MKKNKSSSSKTRKEWKRVPKSVVFRVKNLARKPVQKSVRSKSENGGKSEVAAQSPKSKVEKVRDFKIRANKLIQKGRDRGFVTYDEILKEFPQIENDIVFLDDLYAKLGTAGVDILEGGGLLEVEDLKEKGLDSIAVSIDGSDYEKYGRKRRREYKI